MFRIYFHIAALSLCLTCGTCNIFSDFDENNVISFVETTMNCRDIPGLTLTVVKGNMTWTRGFGMADIDRNIPVTNKTLFLIGSLGKAFTMTLLGMLIEKTRYDWTTKISDIEELSLEFIEDEITREISIADMLSHSSGLSAVTDYGFIGGYPQNVDRKFLSKRTKYIPKISEFQASFVYNNMLYALLGYLSEVLGKDSWQNLMTSRILKPLGMISSKPLETKENAAGGNVAKPYIKPNQALENGNYNIYQITPLEPAGGIMSNAEDMAKWMRFNLKMGQTEDNIQFINRTLFAEAFKNQTMLPFGGSVQSMSQPTYPVDDLTSAYGYAWFTSNYRGHRKVWHSGGLFSYVSLLWLYPNDQAGVFVSVNGPGLPKAASRAQKTILYYISDLLLGKRTWLNHETTCTFPRPWNNFTLDNLDIQSPSSNFTNNDLERFVGTYGSKLLPDVKISLRKRDMESSFLWLEMNRIKGELLLTADESEFRFKMVEPWEYAIERVLTKELLTTYPVRFTGNGTVKAMDLVFSSKEVIRFRKGVQYVAMTNSKSICKPVSALISIMMVSVIVVKAVL